jgi:RimJ/RimL family protein N-acetyltransferase
MTADLVAQDAVDGVDQQVVGAVIADGDSMLVLQRSSDDAYAELWELPSGKVDSGEDLLTALRREVVEETGLEVSEVTGYLGEFDYHSSSGRAHRQHTWSVTVHRSEPVVLSEHHDYAWITGTDQRPVSREVRALLRQHQHHRPGSVPDPWPLASLVVRSPRLELRPDDDRGLRDLALLGAEGVHPAEEMPMAVPWTDATPAVRARGTMQAFWGQRSELRPDDWRVNWILRHRTRGTVLGAMVLAATDFPTLREVSTGSWLGLAHQGRGYGTEARAALLELAFDYLGAHSARTTCWKDNPASLRVSTKLGYRQDGTARQSRRDQPATVLRLLLTHEEFAAHRPDWQIEVRGLKPCRPLLGA